MNAMQDELDAPPPKGIAIGLWRRIFSIAIRRRGAAIIMVVSGVVIALIESFRPTLNAWLFDEAITRGTTDHFWWMVVYWAGMGFAFGATVWIFISAAGRLSAGLAFDLREEAFERLQQLPFSWFDRRPTGWLVSRLTSDCSKVSGIVPWVMLDVFWATTSVVGSAAFMLALDWRVALWMMGLLPLLAIAAAVFQKRLLHSSRLVRRTNSRITASFNEAIAGVRTTKSLAREAESDREFSALAAEMEEHSFRNGVQSSVFVPVVMSMSFLGVAIALWRGGLRVEAGRMSPGELIAFMQYALLFTWPMIDASQRVVDLLGAQAAAERVQSLIDTVPEIQDSPQVRAKVDALRAAGGPKPGEANDGGPPRIRCITFDHVSFGYVVGEPVLKDFSLEVRAGESIALVGATGAGKTTIVNLAGRFYEPTSGRILLDGVDMRERALSWHQGRLGVVQQSPWLRNVSVMENIRYGKLEATDEQVMAAARAVGADDFVRRLEDTWNCVVGEGGERLSLGQRQLLSLARAFLKDPDVFVLDEATSSVDSETERQIQRAVERVLAERISFIIAHRLSTIRHASKILMVDQGEIVESGTHAELMRAHGRYRTLYLQQFVENRERTLLGAAAPEEPAEMPPAAP
ncbi:MAG: ABC transporter ATP-binding protein/permease [Planctomycetes bacterium]|nr:ABC transporter ATP-binding protein/permease [Planctomycetota bacterium]